MGKIYRAIILASASLLLIAAAVPDAKTEAANRKEQQSIAQSLARIATALDEANKPKREAAACLNGKDDRNSELCAQWVAADAAKKATDWLPYEKLFLFLSVALSSIAVWYTARTFGSFRTAERANFDIDELFAGNMKDDGRDATIAFRVFNTGRTAGIIIGGYVEPHICKSYPKRWPYRWPKPKEPTYIARKLIPDGAFHSYAEKLTVSTEDFRSFLLKETEFFVDICIIYKDAFGAKHESRVTANLVLHGDAEGRDVFRVINDPKHWHFT